jgi:type II secretory pathway pseudopilin PulG
MLLSAFIGLLEIWFPATNTHLALPLWDCHGIFLKGNFYKRKGKIMSDNAIDHPGPAAPAGNDFENHSGSGKFYPVPDGVRGWSWGAFFLNWIWAACNRTWIGLLALVPYVGLIVAIVLGVKGREWAWQNRRWQSIEHFNAVQRKWSIWGICVTLLPMAIGILAAIAIPAYQDYATKTKLLLAYQYAEQVSSAAGTYIETAHALPGDIQATGFASPFPSSVQGVAINPASGQVEITVNAPRVEGHSFYLAPSIGPDGKVTWRCLYGDIPRKLLPEQCRYNAADPFSLPPR